jgi:hypothetical protein
LRREIVKNPTLKVYPGFPHGMPTTHADQINADLLAFFKPSQQAVARRPDPRHTAVGVRRC